MVRGSTLLILTFLLAGATTSLMTTTAAFSAHELQELDASRSLRSVVPTGQIDTIDPSPQGLLSRAQTLKAMALLYYSNSELGAGILQLGLDLEAHALALKSHYSKPRKPTAAPAVMGWKWVKATIASFWS